MKPKCKRENCFANINGLCYALSDNNFGGKPCPFFKNKNETMSFEDRVECGKVYYALHRVGMGNENETEIDE